MSFSREVKVEIMEEKTFRSQYKHEFSYGLFYFSNQFTEKEISLRTRQKEVAETFRWLAGSLLGREATIKIAELDGAGSPIYRVWIPKIEERRKLLSLFEKKKKDFVFFSPEALVNATEPEQAKSVYAFIAGAYLACGNVSDPVKNYHLEFVVREPEKAEFLQTVLMAKLDGFKKTERRKNTILYCKEMAQIQDFLTMVGASKACLTMIDIEMYRDLRNQVNRQTNCETANISKQVSASMEQIMDIQLIDKTQGLDSLTPSLKETAELRLAHPDASLRELVELSRSQVSRSGLHHRLANLRETAERIREANKHTTGKKEPRNV